MYDFALGRRDAPDVGAGRGRRGDLQPERTPRRLRTRQQPSCRRCRHAAGGGADDGRQGRSFSTASSIGCIRKRSTGEAGSAATGGALIRPASRFCNWTNARCPSTRWSTTFRIDRTSKSPITPKAGDPQSSREAGIARVSGGAPLWVDLGDYGASEPLIVDVDWVPDAGSVAYQVQDREQTWLDLNLGDATSGRSRRLFRETTKAWVNPNGSPVWLENGSFLWFSERSGFKHLYHYRADGTLIRAVTDGRWDVRTLYGVDEARGVRVLRRGRPQAHRHRRLSHRSRGGRADASVAHRWHAPRDLQSLVLAGHRRVERCHDPRAGAAAWRRRRRDPCHRSKSCRRARRPSPVATGVHRGQGARRLRDGRDDDQAAGLQSVATLSRLPAHLRRARDRVRARTSGAGRRICITSSSRSVA